MQGTSLLFSDYGISFRFVLSSTLKADSLASLCLPDWTPVKDHGQPVDLTFAFEHGPPAPGAPATFRLRVEGETVVGGGSDAELFMKAAGRRVHWYLAKESRREIFVHAGAVAVEGGALLLPGPSFTGKSTMVAHLVARGAQLLSDEYALISPLPAPLTVRPFARPISLRPDAPSAGAGFCGEPASGAWPVLGIVFLEYRPGAKLALSPLSPARAALRLFDNTVAAQRLGGSALERLGQLCAQVTCWEGQRGEASEACRIIEESLCSQD